MDALDYLLSLEKFGIKFGLENIRTLVTALGNPQHQFKSILIAGTNGKGSVTAMVDCALRAAGLRVGRYTSPHLVDLEERFVLNGRQVDRSTLSAVIDELRRLIDGLLAGGSLEAPPTFFEATTAIAFELFRRAKLDVAVLEVGLGGRLDATNIVDPIAAAITSIDFDHEQYLGNTLAAIAAEKGGVIRPRIPVVVAPLAAEARNVIARQCQDAGADLIQAESGVRIESMTEYGRTTVHIRTPLRDYGNIVLGLRGEHQVRNALVAVRLLEQLEGTIPVELCSIAAGLRDVKWPGRLQIVEVSGGRRVLLDAAHNPAGAWALARYLRREFPEPLPIVFGAMRDKDVMLMLKTLVPVASMMIMTEPKTPRAHDAGDLAEIARTLMPAVEIEVQRDPRAAVDRAWSRCPLVCAAGSIFLVGNLLESFGESARDI
jgi:dihydrofolate synthase / folylpolyglutamate synthase